MAHSGMWHIIENSSFCGRVGACAASFTSKDFEILDLNPPNNPTSHYGACHFGYSLALNEILAIYSLYLSFHLSKPILEDQRYLHK